MELSAVWVPMFLLTLDGGFDFHATFNGAPLTEMELRPSEYVRRLWGPNIASWLLRRQFGTR